MVGPTEDVASPASAPALTLTSLTPDTTKTSVEMLVACVALTMPAFPSDPPFTSAATFSVYVIDDSCTEIALMLDPATKVDVAADNPLA